MGAPALDNPLGEAIPTMIGTTRPSPADAAQRSLVDRRGVRVGAALAIVGLILFNPIWTTIRFSRLFGEFLSMQLAYDEPYYFWQLCREVAEGRLEVSYRLFSKLLGAALLSAGASYDAMLTVYAVLLPVLAFAGAVFLAASWERRSLGRLAWAVLLVFSFDFLSGSSRIIDYEPPAVWLADLVGNPALLKPDVLSFFLVHRRPEPQASWIVVFFYWGTLLGAFLKGRRQPYLAICAATPLLAFIYINVALAALLVFAGLSLCSRVVFGRPVTVPFVLSMVATLIVFGLMYAAGPPSPIAAHAVFQTHMPMLRPSVGFALAGLVWAGLAMRRGGARPPSVAAAVFFAVPIVVLNQQLITGLAVMPQNWDVYINYACVVVGAGLMSGHSLSSFERRRDWRQFLPVGLLVFFGVIMVQGALRNEADWLRDNVRSVLFRDVLAQAQARIGEVDAVILPHFFDESLFVTRLPKRAAVLGGYDSMLSNPVPAWRDDQSFDDHARAASANFANGFEVLFRSGITPRQLEANMRGELETGDCWLASIYFFAQGDCWPNQHNYTSTATRRLPSAVPAVVARYRQYLERDAARDLARRKVLLIRNEPLPADGDDLIDNQLVASREIDVAGKPVRAYGYIQRSKQTAGP
jgi:hypothetical protein